MLPHRYPFQLVEERPGGGILRLTANATWIRGEGPLPAALGVEILAQAAICLLPELLEGGGKGLLAGIDQAELHAPLVVGEEWLCRIEIAGRFGRLVKVDGAIERIGGERLVEAKLLLARTDD